MGSVDAGAALYERRHRPTTDAERADLIQHGRVGWVGSAALNPTVHHGRVTTTTNENNGGQP